MNDLTERVEEIAAAMQSSYDADIDLLTRRDIAHVKRITELESDRGILMSQIYRLRTQVEQLQEKLGTEEPTVQKKGWFR